MPDCPRCDGEGTPENKVCPHCGFVFDSGPTPEGEPEPEQSSGMTCSHCGTRVYPGDLACATCGQPLCSRLTFHA